MNTENDKMKARKVGSGGATAKEKKVKLEIKRGIKKWKYFKGN